MYNQLCNFACASWDGWSEKNDQAFPSGPGWFQVDTIMSWDQWWFWASVSQPFPEKAWIIQSWPKFKCEQDFWVAKFTNKGNLPSGLPIKNDGLPVPAYLQHWTAGKLLHRCSPMRWKTHTLIPLSLDHFQMTWRNHQPYAYQPGSYNKGSMAFVLTTMENSFHWQWPSSFMLSDKTVFLQFET